MTIDDDISQVLYYENYHILIIGIFVRLIL